MKIGIFDSGIGGLTVLKELKKRYPNNDYIYVGDTINIPYGEKTKDQLLNLSSKIIEFLIEKNVECIVIACGTVSSNIYNDLNNKYKIKIIDIITPTINYIKENKYKKIGVFATNATINSHIFKNSLNIDVIEEACSEFVPLIESGKILSNELILSIKKHMKNVNCNDIVLGCTHYPIIEDLIEANTINMGKCIKLDNDSGNGTLICYFSHLDEITLKNIKRIIGDVDIRKWNNA